MKESGGSDESCCVAVVVETGETVEGVIGVAPEVRERLVEYVLSVSASTTVFDADTRFEVSPAKPGAGRPPSVPRPTARTPRSRRSPRRCPPRPEGQDEPSDYWLSNLPADTAHGRPARLARLLWMIEVDYRQLKGELGAYEPLR